MIPVSVDMTKLISDVDSIASKHGISISSIVFKQLADKAKQGASVDTPMESSPFKTNSMSFNFDAKYDSMVSFVKDLEKSIQVMDVNSLRMVSGNKGVDSYTLEFQTYSIN